MTLVQAVDDDRKLHNRAHKALLTYHERRRDPLDRALTYYHQRALGGPAKLPRGDKSLKILRGLLDQFSEALEEEVASEIDALLLSRQFSAVRERFGRAPPVIAVGRGTQLAVRRRRRSPRSLRPYRAIGGWTIATGAFISKGAKASRGRENCWSAMTVRLKRWPCIASGKRVSQARRRLS